MVRSFLPAIALVIVPAASATAKGQQEVLFTTLGTQGGPVLNPDRSQPANLLTIDDAAYVIDAGDGVVRQLARNGTPLAQVRAVFLSHLHFDHTAGLSGLLALRYQNQVPGMLAVYGPPGTNALVNGILASMQPGVATGYGVPGEKHADPAIQVRVIEIADCMTIQVDAMRVTAARNTHYSWPPGSDEAARFQSLSLRFDLPDRAIVYTGDTGPSDRVEKLATGADLLVTEMIDVPGSIAAVRRNNPSIVGKALVDMAEHFSRQHLAPEQVGKLAAAANVSTLVVTHMAPGQIEPSIVSGFADRIRRRFHGAVTLASDLQHFKVAPHRVDAYPNATSRVSDLPSLRNALACPASTIEEPAS